MSLPETIAYNPGALPFTTRWTARAAVTAARVLARRRPDRVRRVMQRLCRGARPAGTAQVLAAHRAVTAASLVCAGREGCLPRSIAIALLCRLRGTWPTWCVGVRRMPPFAAHAWVQVDGEPVGEDFPADYFRLFYTVG
ncbi:lasso peptide biosynthesis B2 protein [Catenuloplanes atrovinosus]|uniref:Microcin J25-processing protein McjB C-terminal domain-containing protein n=1 Tax=Catenuloplanes atrovinosus TaxID=137266 RepID=A0AAE3YR72_9ACTN|nr:lasso peptide biosynthesis B2 protein [Catenuloplanes atrovinosus]MDR7276849.1 hypothetical protein [Catenuloplanes atrovinosus]